MTTKEKRLAYYKDWRTKNLDKLKEYDRKRWTNIKSDPVKMEEHRRKSREYYLVCRDDKLRKAREYSKTFASLYSRTGINAIKRGHKLELSLEEFTNITKLPCAYCGDVEMRHGIDRVNNDLGYTQENSVSCCKPCNYMKNKMSLHEFKGRIEKIYKNVCVSQ